MSPRFAAIIRSDVWFCISDKQRFQIHTPTVRQLGLVVVDAMHIGDVRAEPLKVCSETRQAFLDDFISWIKDKKGNGGILWLRGPAGIGKLAIVKSTADRLERVDAGEIVADSFFLWRDDPQRDNLNRLIPALVYRLASSIESVG